MSATSLQKLGSIFSQWRANRTHRSRIPEELWEMAVDAVGTQPLSMVAKAAGIDFYQLRSRVEKKKVVPQTQLAPVAVTKVVTATSHIGTQPLVEIETYRGTRVRFFSETEALKAVLSHVLGE